MSQDTGEMQFKRLQRAKGIAATITRRDAGACTPTIVLGRTDSVARTNRESTYAAGVQDILVAVADYKPGGTPSEPQESDQVAYVSPSGATVTLDVRPPDENTPCFHYWTGDLVYRIHCKVSSREAE